MSSSLSVDASTANELSPPKFVGKLKSAVILSLQTNALSKITLLFLLLAKQKMNFGKKGLITRPKFKGNSGLLNIDSNRVQSLFFNRAAFQVLREMYAHNYLKA